MSEENKLATIVNESGLEPAKGQILLEKFQNYFKMADEWEQKAKAIVVTNENQLAEMEMARTGRLFLREKRISIEKTRKELKEQSLREGKAIDGIANILKALIAPIEEYLEQQEKFVEIREQQKQAAKRLEIEKRMEEERLAQEKAEAEERERIRLENEKLKAEIIEKEKKAQEAIRAEREKAESERRALLEQQRKEQEKRENEIALQQKEREKEIAQQRKEQELKIKKEQEKRALLLKIIESPIECPHCHKTFNRERVLRWTRKKGF